MNNLVTFGDSWPAGEELLPGELPFGKIIAKNLNLNFYNYARAGTPNQSMVLQLKKYINDHASEETIAIFVITEFSRFLFWDENNCDQEISIHSDFQDFYRYYTDKMGQFYTELTISSLQNICQQHKIQDYYVIGWTKWPIDSEIVNLSKIYDRGNTSCLNMFKIFDNDPVDDPNFIYYSYNHYIRPNICHPNQSGHTKIAEKITEWISNDRQNS